MDLRDDAFYDLIRQISGKIVDSKQISSIASTSIVQVTVKVLENTILRAYSYASRLVCNVNMYQQHQILSLRKMSKLTSFQLQKSRIVDYSHLNQQYSDFNSDSDDSSELNDFRFIYGFDIIFSFVNNLAGVFCHISLSFSRYVDYE
ncbi:unnamed protein product [Rotaria socialis]|nr:unnamed protein product [Rotaria socialis]